MDCTISSKLPYAERPMKEHFSHFPVNGRADQPLSFTNQTYTTGAPSASRPMG